MRVSVGSAISLGLLEGKLDAAPTTAYLMTYTASKCTANCAFCPQAQSSQSKTDLLSRVSWPQFGSQTIINQIANAHRNNTLHRVCIQTLNYPDAFQDVTAFVHDLKQQTGIPISVSCQPQNSSNLWSLAQAGVERVGIALDAATELLFNQIKGQAVGGPYRWQTEFELLRTAVGIFGEGNVSTHLIFGLGETEKDVAALMQRCVDMSVLPALFAFTPIRGTALANQPPPPLQAYRRVQLTRYLIVHAITRFEDMTFTPTGELVDFGAANDLLRATIESGEPFRTSGCPNCNRPYYNEKPSGPIYNYPKPPIQTEISEFKKQLNKFL
jgi:biotin synthase